MTDIHETAYPRLKSSLSGRELKEIYSPTPDEMKLAANYARQHDARFCFVLLLKVTQRLGYFEALAEVPSRIIQHVASFFPERKITHRQLRAYDGSRHRYRHIEKIRAQLKMRPFDGEGQDLMQAVAERAADTKEKLPDIINEVLEELIKQRLYRTVQPVYSLWRLRGNLHSGCDSQLRCGYQAGHDTWRYAITKHTRIRFGLFARHSVNATHSRHEKTDLFQAR